MAEIYPIEYEIWSEGYQASGDSGGARFIGKVYALSFQSACSLLLGGNELYNEQANTLWGCRLFDNAADARKRFG